MYITMSFLVLIVTSLLINTKFSNEVNKFATILFVLFIVAALSLNQQNQDYEAYVEFFDDPRGYAEFGYVQLVETLKYIGFTSHKSVLIVLSLVIAYTLHKVTKYSKKISLFLVFYMVFLFPMDMIQIRNTFAVFFSVNALMFFYERRHIKFAFTFFLAFSFHYLGILLCLIILIGSVFMRLEKNKIFIVAILTLIGFVVANFIETFASVYALRTLSFYIAEEKISSVVIWSGTVLTYVFLVEFMMSKNLTRNQCFGASSTVLQDQQFAKFVYNVIIASLVFSGGLYFLYEFNRVYRFTLFLMILHAGGIFAHIRLADRFLILSFFIVIFFGLGLIYSSSLNYDYIVFGL